MKNMSTQNVANSTTVVTNDNAIQVNYVIQNNGNLSLKDHSLLDRVFALFSKDYRCGLYGAFIAANIKEKVSLNTYIPYHELGYIDKSTNKSPRLSLDEITKNHIAILTDCKDLPRKYVRPDMLSMLYVEGKDRVKETFLCNQGIAVVEAPMYSKYAFKIDTEISYLLKKSDSELIISKVSSILGMTDVMSGGHLVCSVVPSDEDTYVVAKFTSCVRFPDYINSWRPYLAYHVPGIDKEVMYTIESFGRDNFCMRGDIQKHFYRCHGYFNIELNSPYETLIISSAKAYYGFNTDYNDVLSKSHLTELYRSLLNNQSLVPGFKIRVKKTTDTSPGLLYRNPK